MRSKLASTLRLMIMFFSNACIKAIPFENSDMCIYIVNLACPGKNGKLFIYGTKTRCHLFNNNCIIYAAEDSHI